MCRRLKHIDLCHRDSNRVLRAILDRFASGNFAEQFRDMLRLAVTLDSEATYSVAQELSSDRRGFVRRQAEWLVQNHSPKTNAEQ